MLHPGQDPSGIEGRDQQGRGFQSGQRRQRRGDDVQQGPPDLRYVLDEDSDRPGQIGVQREQHRGGAVRVEHGERTLLTQPAAKHRERFRRKRMSQRLVKDVAAALSVVGMDIQHQRCFQLRTVKRPTAPAGPACGKVRRRPMPYHPAAPPANGPAGR